MNWYKLTPADLVVIYDDLDLPPGKLRLRPGGGAWLGHKGVLSIIHSLGTENFPQNPGGHRQAGRGRYR